MKCRGKAPSVGLGAVSSEMQGQSPECGSGGCLQWDAGAKPLVRGQRVREKAP